jgi:hypothetical protein
MAYVDWCGSLVANDFASTKIPWIMCNGRSANSIIETCNGCHCFDGGWMDRHRRTYPNQPLMLTEDWGTFQFWGLEAKYLSFSTIRIFRYPVDLFKSTTIISIFCGIVSM